jgi:uncharacterized membrane protein YtjA (UPF0391 family)
MFQYAAVCFGLMLLASLAGFGGVLGTAVAATKALAVIFLLLFFASLFRGLYQA